MRFFHQGQFEGHRKRISPHLGRGPEEATDEGVKKFYERLLRILQQPIVREGTWQLLHCEPAWEGNWTSACYIAFAWQMAGHAPLVMVVNYAANQSQCHVRLPIDDLAGREWCLHDQLSDQCYHRSGDDLGARGLFVDHAPWQAAVFSLARQ